MEIIVKDTARELGQEAGALAATLVKNAIAEKGTANIILATGASQFETINRLIEDDIDWSKVVMFHLDEYISLPESHKASFRKYLKERFLEKVPALKASFLINGENDITEELAKLKAAIEQHPIDVALVGVGENGHLAFNDPPADFDTEEPYIVANLDNACRLQQVNEGWFENLEQVPPQAISMSIQQILKSKHIICSVPDKRKAQAVKDCFKGTVTNLHPASILQQHAHCKVYLDKPAASLL